MRLCQRGGNDVALAYGVVCVPCLPTPLRSTPFRNLLEFVHFQYRYYIGVGFHLLIRWKKDITFVFLRLSKHLSRCLMSNHLSNCLDRTVTVIQTWSPKLLGEKSVSITELSVALHYATTRQLGHPRYHDLKPLKRTQDRSHYNHCIHALLRLRQHLHVPLYERSIIKMDL